MRFKSKVDAWFYLTIAATAVAIILALGPVVKHPTIANLLVVAAVLVLALGLPLWLLASTYYQVEAEVLEIHSGPFHWSVALSDIQSVRPSRSLLSAPALSLDRLELRCASGRQLLVSPRDRMGFLDAIGQAISKD